MFLLVPEKDFDTSPQFQMTVETSLAALASAPIRQIRRQGCLTARAVHSFANSFNISPSQRSNCDTIPLHVVALETLVSMKLN